MRLKDIVSLNPDALKESTPDNYTFRYVDLSAVHDGVIDYPRSAVRFGEAPTRARRLAREGDTLIATVFAKAPEVASVRRLDFPTVFSTGFCVARPRPEIADARYVTYLCASVQFGQFEAARLRGVGIPSVSPTDIGAFPVELPPLQEQRRIADYLDEQSNHVSQLKAATLRQSSLSRERFESALVQHFAPSRDGIEELELRRVLSSIKTGSTPMIPEADPDHGFIPWYTPTSIGAYATLGGPVRKFPQTSSDQLTRFNADSILVVGIGESIGNVAYLDHSAAGNQQLTALRPNASMLTRYLLWQLWVKRSEHREQSSFTRVRILNNEYLKSVRIVRVPVEQQASVVRTIDTERERLSGLLARLASRIELAVQRLDALTSLAVTGQLDVTTARKAA